MTTTIPSPASQTEAPSLRVTFTASRKKGPIEAKCGSFSAKIYTIHNQSNGKSYLQFKLVYSLDNKWTSRKFSDLNEAKTEAEFALTKLSNHETKILGLADKDYYLYVRSLEHLASLKPHLNAEGVPALDRAVEDYAAALKRLPVGVGLKEVVDFYLKRHPTGGVPKTVGEVVDEFIQVKTESGKSQVYLNDLQSRLGRVVSAFIKKDPATGKAMANAATGKPVYEDIVHITGTQLYEFLRDLKLAGRTQNNYRQILVSLMRFAIKRKYLPRDYSELDAVERVDADEGDIEIFSPEELCLIFRNTRPEMVPWLAIGAFAGLRHAELQRLDWSEVHLTDRFIEIRAAKAKTASRRLVPITDNLAAWLAPYAKPFGRVSFFDNMANQITSLVEDIKQAQKRLAKKAGQDLKDVQVFAWKHNALRHSFVSYRLADVKDAARVALEAGNSPQMVFRNYRQLVTEAQAKAWFAIVPDQAKVNVIPMPAAVTA